MCNDMPIATARYIWNKYQEIGTTDDQPKSARQKKVTPEVEARVIELALEDRQRTYASIGNLVQPPVSATTVQNVLKDYGYHQCCARKVLSL
jgi:hypothetical protein